MVNRYFWVKIFAPLNVVWGQLKERLNRGPTGKSLVSFVRSPGFKSHQVQEYFWGFMHEIIISPSRVFSGHSGFLPPCNNGIGHSPQISWIYIANSSLVTCLCHMVMVGVVCYKVRWLDNVRKESSKGLLYFSLVSIWHVMAKDWIKSSFPWI